MLLHGIDLGSPVIADFCGRWQIDELAVFGSILSETFRADSDVDVLVTFPDDAPWDLLDLLRMQDELSGLLGRPVDLASRRGIEEGANRIVRHKVLTSAETIYAKG
jgi:uncharacterized protein